MSNTVTIHQPNFCPSLSVIAKMKKADTIILYDNCFYTQGKFIERNRFRADNEDKWKWVTVPLENKSPKVKIKNLRIVEGSYDKLVNFFKENFKYALNFDIAFPVLETAFRMHDGFKLSDLNNYILTNILFPYFGVEGLVYSASHLFPDGVTTGRSTRVQGTDALVSLCAEVKATQYLSGPSGRDYLETEKFSIPIQYHTWDEPSWNQSKPGFISNMSSLEYVLCNAENRIL